MGCWGRGIKLNHAVVISDNVTAFSDGIWEILVNLTVTVGYHFSWQRGTTVRRWGSISPCSDGDALWQSWHAGRCEKQSNKHCNYSSFINGILAGIMDSSGMRFYYSSTSREHDAGIMFLGHDVTSYMVIPPGTSNYTIGGICTANCTKSVCRFVCSNIITTWLCI